VTWLGENLLTPTVRYFTISHTQSVLESPAVYSQVSVIEREMACNGANGGELLQGTSHIGPFPRHSMQWLSTHLHTTRTMCSAPLWPFLAWVVLLGPCCSCIFWVLWTNLRLPTFVGIIYHCDLTKEELEPRVFREVTVKGIDASDYQTIQVWRNWSHSCES
jgi:hypothetical protein